MDAETRLRREIKLLRSDLANYPAGNLDRAKQREILRELADEEMKLRMAAMTRIRAPASLAERLLHKIGIRVGRIFRIGRERLIGA
jgi:hypothetical protein